MNRLEHPDGITPIRPDAPTVADMFDRFLATVEGLRDAYERDRAHTQAEIADIRSQIHTPNDQGWRWLSVAEAIDYLSISRAQLYRLINAQLITRYGPAHMPRFRSDDLDAYLERTSRNAS